MQNFNVQLRKSMPSILSEKHNRFTFLNLVIMYCTVSATTLSIYINGIVPSLIASVYVYMYAVDSPKRQEEAMNTGSQSPSSFRLVSWFILRADRDTGPTA